MASLRSYVFLHDMLGFVPGKSAAEYRDHADRLLSESSDPLVRQVCDWWQTPECWYAYESKEGAIWWAKNGGPSKYAKKLAEIVPSYPAVPITSVPVKTPCFCCEKDLFKSDEEVELCVLSCVCSTWYMHVKCRSDFIFTRCFKCSSLYSDTVITKSLCNLV
jgi:hypothetical protein